MPNQKLETLLNLALEIEESEVQRRYRETAK